MEGTVVSDVVGAVLDVGAVPEDASDGFSTPSLSFRHPGSFGGRCCCHRHSLN